MGQYFVGDKVVRTKYSVGMVGVITDTLVTDGYMYEVRVIHSHNMRIEEGELQRWSRKYFEPWWDNPEIKPAWEV
jgi:hypothetical protein